MSNSNARHAVTRGKYFINLTVDHDNAQANGSDKNTLTAVVQDGSTFYPVPAAPVVFKIVAENNNTVFSESSSVVYSTVTDGLGKAYASVISQTPGNVEVTVESASDPGSKNSETITFTATSGAFRIREIVNLNHTLKPGGPTVAWAGAAFKIVTEGGNASGKVLWEVLNGSAEITVENSPTGDGIVTIVNQPRSISQVRGTDEATGESVEYSFAVTLFIMSDQKKHTLSNVNDYVLTPKQYTRLYEEWGNMSSYPVWKTDDVYWTSERGLFSALTFNLANGTENSVDPHFKKKYYAYSNIN